MNTGKTVRTQKVWSERTLSLDLMRIVACIGVIGIHVLMDYRMHTDGTGAGGVIFAESLLRWPVPCFLMLSGYFLFQREIPLKKLLLRIIRRLALPAAAVTLFISVFGAWVLGISGLRQCVSNFTWSSLLDSVGRMLRWELPEPGFWLGYIITAMKMYLLYPVLKFICKDTKEANESRWFLMALLFGGQILIPFLKLPIYVYAPFDTYGAFFFLFGYEAFRMKKRGYLDSKWMMWGSAAVFLLSGIFTWVASMYLDIGNSGTFSEIYFGYTSLNIAVEAAAVFLFFLSIPVQKTEDRRHWSEDLLLWLSGRTMSIYLVHYLVILKIRSKGYDEKLSQLFGGNNFFFFAAYILAVFFLSLAVAAFCSGIRKIFLRVGKILKMWYTTKRL